MNTNHMTPADVLKSNPLMGFAIVAYSYYLEEGSDGCWGRTVESTCTLAEWVSGRVYDRHSGNRSYNFALKSIEDASTDTLLERKEAARKEAEAIEAKDKAAALERKMKADAFKARVESWVGAVVTVKGKAGVVERSMESRYDDGKIAMLVRFADGSKKWHSEGKVKLA
jgi:hypothetical protein